MIDCLCLLHCSEYFSLAVRSLVFFVVFLFVHLNLEMVACCWRNVTRNMRGRSSSHSFGEKGFQVAESLDFIHCDEGNQFSLFGL